MIGRVRNEARPGAVRGTPTRSTSTTYNASGTGLVLAAPKVPASFIVSSSVGSKLRMADLKITLKGAAKVDHEVKERRDGSLLVKYVSHMSGDVIITLMYGRTNVEGSPFKARCSPPKAEAGNSIVELLQEHAFIEETVKAAVRTYDQFGERCGATGDIQAMVLDAATNSPLFEAHVVETGVGDYEVSFVPEMAGLYSLNVLIGGHPAQGCPMKVKVLADETLAKNCRCFGAGMAQCMAGEPTSFTIQAVDGRGVARKQGGDNFDVSIRGPEGDNPHATIRDNAEGTYTVTWTGKHTGLYAVHITLDGQSVGGTPFNCNCHPTVIAPEACTAQAVTIARVRAGEKADFRIIARDRFGNVRSSGGDVFTVVLKMVEGPGQTEVRAAVNDESKGFYKANFTVQHTGVYQVHVLAEGQPIQGSPFRCEATSGRPDFTKCKLGGPGLEAVRLGQPCDVLIELYDIFSNKITSALDALSDIQVSVDGPSRVSVNPAGMKQGSACFQYVAMHPGVYTVTATIEGRHINNSPATVTASIAKPHAPLCEVLTNTKDLLVSAGKDLRIIFVAKDKAGIRKSVGGDIFSVSWRSLTDKHGPACAARVTDLGTGEYYTMFTETTAGAYGVAIMHEDRHIAGSPLTVTVKPSTLEPSKTTASGQGLVQSVATQPATIQVLARDLFGNTVKDALKIGPGEIEAVLRGPETIELAPVKIEAGCVTLSYVCTKTGTYDLSVTHMGHHISGSPWKVSVMPGPAIAAMCSLRGLPSSIVAGQPFSFTLHTVDECKNPTISTNTVTAEVDSPSDGVVPLSVTEDGHGVYKIAGVLKGAEASMLRLLVNGSQLPNVPVMTVVSAAPVSIAWASSSLASHGLTVPAGEEAFVELVCLDAYGNRINNATQGVAAQIRHDGGQGAPLIQACRTSPMPDGTVRVYFRPERATTYQLYALIAPPDGQPSKLAPIMATITCQAGPMDMGKSSILRSDSSLVAGKSGCLVINCADVFGNPTTNVPAVPIAVTPSGPGKMNVWWERPPRTTQLTVYYTSNTAGTYSLSLASPTAGSMLLKGSPLQVVVEPESPCAARCSAVAYSQGRRLTAGSATLTAGQVLEVHLSLADVYGNPVSECDAASTLEVFARAVSGPSFTLQATAPAAPGKPVTFSATTERAGLYSIQVRILGTPLPGWSLPLLVQPAKAHASACRLRMPANSTTNPPVGQQVSVVLSTADAFGNARHDSGPNVSPMVMNPDQVESSRASVKDLSDGQYLISFTPDEPGEWVVSAIVDGEEISPGHEVQVMVEVPPLTVDMCSIYVPDDLRQAPAGSSIDVAVLGPDNCDSLPPEHTECIVHLTAPDMSVASFPAAWDRENMAFIADVFLGTIGSHTIWATINGVRVGGAEGGRPIHVVPNSVELNASDISGSGLLVCHAGEQAEVTMQARDALGNAGASITGATGGPLGVQIVVEAADGTVNTVTMKPDPSKVGNLKATYIVKKAGPVKLAVQLTEQVAAAEAAEAADAKGGEGAAPKEAGPVVIQQRTFSAVCKPGKPSPLHFELQWGREPLVAGVEAHLRVVCKDAYQNLLQVLPGNELWSAFLQQGNSQVGTVEVQPMTDSRYGFSIRCDSAGPTSLLLTFGGTTLFNGPIPMIVTAAEVSVLTSSADFVGTATSFVAGRSFSVRGVLRDALHNEVPATEQHHLEVALAPGRTDAIMFNNQSGWRKFQSDGTTAHCTVEKAGTYIVHASVGDTSLPGWPRIISIVAADADAKRCTVHLEKASRLLCGARSKLTLVTRDGYGNRCAVGGARVEVAARALGSVQPGQVTDHGDGTYSLGLVLDVEGDWDITASVYGVPVAGMPLRVKASYPPLTAADCELSSVDTSVPIAAGVPTRLTVQAKGVEKTRRMFTGAESIAVVTIDDAGHEVRVPVILENKGMLATASLLPLLPGSLKVSVIVNGEQLTGSPMTFEVTASPMSPAHCSVMPVTPDIAAAYKLQLPAAALLVVTGTDALGNPTRVPQDDIALTFTPPSNVTEIVLQTLSDGTVAVCGVVRSEVQAHVSVQGTKLTQVPVVLRPAMRLTSPVPSTDGTRPDGSRSLNPRPAMRIPNDASRLRVLQAPDATPIAGEEFRMVAQICDVSGGMLHHEGTVIVASLTMKVDAAGMTAATPRTTDALGDATSLSGMASLPSTPGAPGASPRRADEPRESLTLGLPGSLPTHSVPVSVTPLGSGMFALEAIPQVAGMYSFRATVDSIANEASMLTLPVEVRPGKLAPEKCAVLLEARTCNAWSAGKTARMVVRLFDRFLNPVHDVDISQLDVKVTGPGNVLHTAAYGSTGKSSIELRLTGRVAGRYEVSVRDRASGKLLGGPAITLTLHASNLNPQLSSFHLRGLQVKGSQASVQAGQTINLALSIFDAFGNTGEVSGANTEVHASGPMGVITFRPSITPSTPASPPTPPPANGDATAPPPSKDVIVPISLTKAGQYRLTVEIRGDDGQVLKLPGAPGHDVLHVKPAAASPSHTIIESWPAADKPMPTGAPHNLIIVPCDMYGNVGAQGAAFIVQLEYPKDTGERTVMSITPSGNSRGDLIATVVPRAIGTPSLQVLCAPSGSANNGATPTLVASRDVRIVEAPTDASMCFLSGVWPESGAVVGAPAGMLITAADAFGNLRRSGEDRFTVEVPGLARQAITVTDRGDGSYTVEFVPAHEGTVSVHVMLDGVHVRGSPMSLSVHRDIDQLARSALTGKLSTAVTGLRRGLDQARRMQSSLRADAEQLQQYVPVLVQSAASDLSNLMREQMRLLQDARLAVNREGAERRRLHNLVQELRGNIRVYVRVKPLTADEVASGLRSVLHCPTDTRIECNTGTATKAFDFDRVFSATASQSEVFAEVSALVTSALDGYNVCVFAYGQTGSGKTHTMEGPVDDPGISFRTLHELFRVINTERHTDHSHVISASIVEIYNEQVRDLLSGGEPTDLELQKTSSGFIIPGLTKVPVSSAEQITQVMATGYEARVTACHDINAHSSRSHALLIIEVAATNLASGIRTIGKLTLCDLAGSERVNKTGASGLNLVEAQNINKSLLELGNVMSALMSNSSHVPYRNSKLTMLLQDSLGGDSKALMFCNLAPQPAHVSETLSSLAFASKVSSVVLRTPGRRVEDASHGPEDAPESAGPVTPGMVTPPPSASQRSIASSLTSSVTSLRKSLIPK